MTGKTLIEPVNPKTQSIDDVKILLQWRGHPTSPMPTDVTLGNGRMVLVLSNKKDAYYTVTAKACSHLAATYHCGLCKHQRHYFADQIAKPAEMDSILPGLSPFGSVSLLPSEETAAEKV